MDLKDLLQLAGLTNNAHAHSDDSLAHNGADEMRKLVVMIDPEQLNTMEPSGGCGCGSEDCGCDHDHDHMEEETVEEWANSGDHVSGEPEQMTNGHGELGSAVDTSLRRYLDASGANVKVDEQVYPDHTLEDISEAYAAFKEGKKGKKDFMYKDRDAYDASQQSSKKVSLSKAPWEDDEDEDKKDKKVDEGKKDFMYKDRDAYDASQQSSKKVSLKKAPWEDDEDEDEDKKVDEASKPDFLDIDGDGDKEESMKKAAKDKKEAEVDESINELKKLAGLEEAGPKVQTTALAQGNLGFGTSGAGDQANAQMLGQIRQKTLPTPRTGATAPGAKKF